MPIHQYAFFQTFRLASMFFTVQMISSRFVRELYDDRIPELASRSNRAQLGVHEMKRLYRDIARHVETVLITSVYRRN
jgi:hypothetical protein